MVLAAGLDKLCSQDSSVGHVVWRTLPCRGPPERLLGASWGPLGCSWRPLGALLGASWGRLGGSCAHLAAPWRLLGPFGCAFGPSWGAPGGFVAAPGARRGCFWALLGRSRRPFGYPWRARRRFWTPKRGGARDIVKHTVLRGFCVVLGPPGPLRGCQNGSGTAHVGYRRPM